MVLNKEAQLAVVNDYEGLRDNPQLEVTTLAENSRCICWWP